MFEAREILTVPDSKGCRNTSKLLRSHSANSSKNNTPLCANEISPGFGIVPPPTKATALEVWCGLRNGRCRKRVKSKPRPDTDAIAALSIASSSEAIGKIPGRRDANNVFPQPGDPINKI